MLCLGAVAPAGAAVSEVSFPNVRKAPGPIEIDSFSWGVSSSGGEGNTAGGRVDFQDLHYTAKPNTATPYMAHRVATGRPLEAVKITVHDREVTGLLMTYCAQQAIVRRLEVHQDGVVVGLDYRKLSVAVELDLGPTIASFDLTRQAFSLGSSPDSACREP